MGSIMFSNNIMKQCNMCNEIKPLSEYYKFSNKNNPERVYYQSYCKKCANKRRAENWRKQRAREREILASAVNNNLVSTEEASKLSKQVCMAGTEELINKNRQ